MIDFHVHSESLVHLFTPAPLAKKAPLMPKETGAAAFSAADTKNDSIHQIRKNLMQSDLKFLIFGGTGIKGADKA